MSDEYKSPVFRKWLDALQQESWQLELIISGFALYALFSAYGPVSLETKRAIAMQNTIQIYFMLFLVASLSILILNLTAHVILRGLWIGAIGLRYVSGDIDYDELRYSLRFRNYLEDRVGSFDKFIANLEKYCSVIFASTFLTVFYILSLFIIFAVMFSSSFLIMAIANEPLRSIVMILIWLSFGLGAILVFVDFVTQGWLKRNKWLSKFYYPYYRFFTIFTLAFIYRPIIYNLLDNKFGRRLIRLLIPIYIVIMVITSLGNLHSNYIPVDFEDPSFRLERFESIALPVNYEDELGDDKFARIISIQSKMVTTNYLKIFVPFNERIEDLIYERCQELLPENDRRGIYTTLIKVFDSSINKKRNSTMEYIECFQDLYSLKIDGLEMKSSFVISQNSKGQSGFETAIGLGDLAPGKHILVLSNSGNDKESVLARVPFWYLPE